MVFPVPILASHPQVRIKFSAIAIQPRGLLKRFNILSEAVIPPRVFRLHLATEMLSKHPLCKRVQNWETRIDKEMSIFGGKAEIAPFRNPSNLADQSFYQIRP
jgi:hypothetical protein